MVAVDAQLGVVGEVGAELEEERAEVVVHTVEVEVVDQPGRPNDPRVGLALVVAAFLGSEQAGLLLRPADEQHTLAPTGRLELGQELVHHVVLALALGEVHPRDLMDRGEPVHRGRERFGDLGQRRRRGDRQAELLMHVSDQPSRVLQARDVGVEIHPVDRLDLEHHALGENIGDGAG